jgi:phage-related tail fiber protein
MSKFGGLYFTSKGRALQSRTLTGTPLHFTKIAVGDGTLSGQAIEDLNALIHEVKTISINTLKTMPGGQANVGGVLSNQNLTNGFYWRELGLFTQDPIQGEILYCYGNAGTLADYIPSPGGADIIEKQINVLAIIGNAANVTATINQSLVYATKEELKELPRLIISETEPQVSDSKIFWLQEVGENFSFPTGDGVVIANAGFEDTSNIKFEEL